MKLMNLVTPLLSLDAKFVSEKNVKIRQNSTFSLDQISQKIKFYLLNKSYYYDA